MVIVIHWHESAMDLHVFPSWSPLPPPSLPDPSGSSQCTRHEHLSHASNMHPMFIAALFIIARTWKQPRCPSADECRRKLWYIYTMEYYSAIKKNSFESVVQSCLTLWDPMDCSLPGSSIYGIFEARVLEWVAISFSRGSYQSRDWTQVSCSAGRCFTTCHQGSLPYGGRSI